MKTVFCPKHGLLTTPFSSPALLFALSVRVEVATGSFFGDQNQGWAFIHGAKPGKRLLVWTCGLACTVTVKVLKNPKRTGFAKCSCSMQSADSDVCLR